MDWTVMLLLCFSLWNARTRITDLEGELKKEKERRALDVNTLWDKINGEGSFKDN